MTSYRKKLMPSGLAALFLAAGLTACAENPATGKQEFSLVSPAQERAIGAQEHPKVLAQFGGAYDDPDLGAYIARLGGQLVANSELKGQEFTFTLLDSPVVNAFALPGGYVYVSRGLLALANDESELASVIGHEIGHVTARHGAQRQTRGTLANILQIGAAIAFENEVVNQVGQLAGAAYISSYSRGQEYEADQLGIRYLGRMGYDTYASGDLLGALGDHSDLQAKMAGVSARSSAMDFFATHPRSADRVTRADQSAKGWGGPGKPRNRDRFLQMTDGMVYGDSEEQGFVRDRKFLHPILALGFEVPENYVMSNSAQAVGIRKRGANDMAMQFDGAALPQNMSIDRYLTEEWAKGTELSDVQRIRVNDMPAAAGRATLSNGNTAYLAAIQYDDETVYRFLMMTATSQAATYRGDFIDIVESFRRLSRSEADELKPWRIKVHTVRRGETLSALARRTPFKDYAVEQLRIMNRLEPNEGLREGMKIKLVVEE